tara:strand:+ start:327 stop:830 length:504 start_codon:yes stop_codon:yes gene_type:complete
MRHGKRAETFWSVASNGRRFGRNDLGTVTLSRKFEFSSSHRYWRADWSDDQNAATFGLCALPNGHGHNYTLEVSVSGQPDPDTGMVINLVDLKDAVDSVLAEFDHKHLNLDTSYFDTDIPTTENFAVVLWRLISSAIIATGSKTCNLHRLRLYETSDLYVEYTGEFE